MQVRHFFDPRLDIDYEDDLRFINRARKAIAMGLTVIYAAQW